MAFKRSLRSFGLEVISGTLFQQDEVIILGSIARRSGGCLCKD